MLSFTQPWFLLGFAGLALPLLAHLIQTQQSRVQLFPSIRFIQASKLPQSSERRLSDLLLLLLRLLLLSSLILALAGMFWQTADTLKSQRETIIIIDNSASMSSTGKQQELQRRSQTLLESNDTKLGLVIFAQDIQHALKPQSDRTALRSILQNNHSSLTQGSPQLAIDTALNLFSLDIEQKQLIIFSDFQSSDWQNVSAGLQQSGIKLRLESLAHYERNVSIQHALVSPISADSLRVSVQIRNDADTVQAKTLKLTSGATRWEQNLSLTANSLQQAFFEIPRAQHEKAELSFTQSDEYAADDTFFLWLKEPPAISCAVLSTPFDNDAEQTEAFFVRTALESHSAYDWQSYTLSSALYLDNNTLDAESPLWQSAFIFVAGFPGDISQKLLQRLHSYMNKGGTLMVTPGYSTAQALEKLSKANILKARYLGTQRKELRTNKPFRIKDINAGSVIKALFAGDAENDLKLTRIYKYLELELAEKADVLLTVDGGKPLLIKKAVGEGRFIFANLRFFLEWTDLPLGNSFLPLIRELLSAENNAASWPTLNIGHTLEADASRGSLNTTGEKNFVASQAGLFQHEEHFISVNVSRRESSNKQLSDTQIRENLGATVFASNGATQLQPSDNGNADINTGDSTAQKLLLWPWLLLFACLLFVVESILARVKALSVAEGS